jgi:hypothetical protein
MVRKKKSLLSLVCSIACMPTFFHASTTFLKPRPWAQQEPRLERPFLASIDVAYGYLRAKKSYNQHGAVVPLLALYPLAAQQVETSTDAKFHGHELDFRFTQNFNKGLFFTLFVPYERYHIRNIDIPGIAKSITNKGIGDLETQLGWTYSYQNTTELDFIDIMLRAGALVPTAKRDNPTDLIPLPLGNNGHPALLINAATCVGAFEWLTVGCGIETAFSCAREQSLLIQNNQNATTTLSAATAEPGIYFVFESFIKADHFVRGLSFGIGYNYTHQAKTHFIINLPDNSSIVQNRPTAKGFLQHTINLFAEYDFTKEGGRFGPRVGIAYSFVAGGKNCFKSSLAQGTFGLEIVMNY